jgi:hypothetical protein
MTRRIFSTILTALTVILFSMPNATALAKQQCSASVPSDPHGYWSWRIIDGRKCWYLGKPMLSKSSLEWPAKAADTSNSNGEPANAPTGRSGDPLEAQAKATDSESFDALWHARIGHH